MEPNFMKSERVKVGNGEKEDRISSLPGTILAHILSFLPTKYAVETCILSSRWKFVWTSIHNVSLDYRLWTKNGSTNDSWTKFQKFTNRVLLLSDLVNIDRFSITCVDPRDLSHLKFWVSVAIRRNVRELELNIRNFYPDELPDSFYTSRALEVVKLNLDYFIETSFPPEMCFPNVKILHITVHSQDNNFTEKLFSNCPVIEDLSIRAFLLDGEVVTNINISSPTLKRLNLIIERDEFSYNEHQIVVRATNLEFLYISNFTFVSYVMDELPSLNAVAVAISFNKCFAEEFDSPDDPANRVLQLLRGITNTRFLSLSAGITSALDCAFDDLFPTFSNLNFLELVVGEFGCRFLPIILISMPKLKAFVLEKLHVKQIEIRGLKKRKMN